MSTNTTTLPFINPATGEQFGEVAAADQQAVIQAHKEMKQNFAVWRRNRDRRRWSSCTQTDTSRHWNGHASLMSARCGSGSGK